MRQAKGQFKVGQHGFNVYVLPGDVWSRWPPDAALKFVRGVQSASVGWYNGDMRAAYHEWARQASEEDQELGRKALWELVDVRV
ncbi:MAG TPA: hypothetical protein VGN26_11960 [Armatimonadota bacterium]|jgi:hypothetical protein